MIFLKRIKSFFVGLAKLTGQQILLLGLIIATKTLLIGSFFIVFYFIFQYDSDKSFISNFPMMIIIGIVIGFWFAIIDILKLQMKKTEKDVSKIGSVVIRGIYSNRYIILFLGGYYFFAITFSFKQIMLYLVIVIVCRFIGKYTQSWLLKLQDLDWSVYDE